MPNPFLRRPMATSKVDVDRPQSMEPIPENVRGHVFAYRGMETHGVDPNNEWRDPEEYDGYERGVEVNTEPVEQEPDPIPVRVVWEEQTEEIAFTGTQYTVLAQKEISIPRDPNRRALRIVNINAFNNIYISATSGSQGAFTGYPLRPGAELPINSMHEVYIFNAEPVNSIQIGVYYEYAVLNGRN